MSEKENTGPLAGEVALVTGATRGIGAAIADELAAQGATVIGTATSDAGATAIGQRLAARNGHGRVLNVTERGAIEALIDALGKEFGGVSILVNNAGITRDNLLMRMKDDDWQAILDTNLTSVYRSSKAVMRGMMKARKGRIINIASVIGVTGNAGQSNYAAAKAGIIAFSKSLAREIGSRGVTVNVVAPGFIDTDMTRDLPDDARNAMLGQIALGRLVSLRTSPARSLSWPARPPPTSPARPSTSTAACTCPEAGPPRAGRARRYTPARRDSFRLVHRTSRPGGERSNEQHRRARQEDRCRTARRQGRRRHHQCLVRR
jgi:3-oxoacyl-[acyl-carrier protein] reductase